MFKLQKRITKLQRKHHWTKKLHRLVLKLNSQFSLLQSADNSYEYA